MGVAEGVSDEVSGQSLSKKGKDLDVDDRAIQTLMSDTRVHSGWCDVSQSDVTIRASRVSSRRECERMLGAD